MNIEQLSTKLRQAPQVTATWYELGLALLEEKWATELMDLVQLRQQMFEDGLAFFYQLLFKADQPDQKAKVVTLAALIPPDSLLSIISDFFAGCIALQNGKTALGFQKLTRSAERASMQAPLFMKDDHLSNIIAQQYAIFSPAMVASLPPDVDRGKLPDLHGLNRTTQHGRVFFTACNGLYFSRFGQSFIETFQNYGHLHIHIANPRPLDQPAMEAARASGVSLSTEESASLASAHYFACMRFLRASEIAKKFGCPLVILDIDFSAVNGLLALLEHSKQFDVCYFRTGCVMPWIDHHAAYFYLADTEGGHTYAGRLSRYIQSALGQGFWGLDQAAMSALYHYYLGRPGEVAINTLVPQDGFVFDDYFTVSGTTEEKWAMRHKAKSAAPQ